MPSLNWLSRIFRGKERQDGRRRNPEGAPGGNGAAAGGGNGTAFSDRSAGAAVSFGQSDITEEELSSLDQRDRQMLRSIIDMDYTTVREVMVPRVDMVTIEAGVSLREAAAVIVEHGHSRLPVYVETIDDVLGILYVRDLLAAMADLQPEASVRMLTRPAFIVPETKRVDELLEEFRQRRTQIAIVVDEYGGTEGLVTMEDVLEEIVGEIEDEFSRSREAEVIWQEDGSAVVNAGLGAEEVYELFGVDIESDDFDTVGGFVYHHLGRIPQEGDSVVKGRVDSGSPQRGGAKVEDAQDCQRKRRRHRDFRLSRRAPCLDVIVRLVELNLCNEG